MTELLDILSPYKGKMVLVSESQNVPDIIKLVNRIHKKTANDYDKISEMFWKGNVKDTARGLFDFLKKNVEYKIEPGTVQTVKTPAAILAQKKGDCKHYASFIMGVVDSLNRKGYPISGGYMYVNNNANNDNYHHVFAVVVDPETGKEYFTDPIYDRFDIRKPAKKSKFINMALYEISGDTGIGGKAERQAKRAQKKETKADKKKNKQANKEARKANAKARKVERQQVRAMPKEQRKAYKKANRQDKRKVYKDATGVQKTRHILMKVPNAASRGAFLALLKLNAFKMASKIARKAKEDPAWLKELQKQWLVAGGAYGPLRQAVNQGVNVYNAKFKDKVSYIAGGFIPLPTNMPVDPIQRAFCNCDTLDDVENNADAMGIGADPYTWASIAAIVAAAMPLIMKLMGLLKKAGVDEDEMNEAGMDSADEMIDQYNDATDYPLDEDERINPNSDTPQYGIKAYNRAGDGTATVEVTKTNVDDNGDVRYNANNTDLAMTVDSVKDWVIDNKQTLIYVGVGLAALKFGPDLIASFSGKKRRR